MPRPSIMMAFTACMYQRAGIMLENICKGNGMFSTGKIIPDSSITGIINPIPEISMAAICVCARVEINNPNASATKM